MKNLMKDYQLTKAYYTLGDINRDNKLDNVDLQLLREYLDDATDYNLIIDYLAGKVELTEEEKTRLDVNHDSKVDIEDEKILQKELDDKYSLTFRNRADVNEDGYINELDYTILENEVTGKTNNLKQFNISFMLGWCDVQTEALFETDFNYSENISEVSK